MSFLISTTGTVSPVVFNDLGGRTLVHPTVDLDLELEFSTEDLLDSEDISTALDAAQITVKDAQGNVLTLSADLLAVAGLVGATPTLDGEAGVVPRPSAGDESKFLRGDASWSLPSPLPLLAVVTKMTDYTATPSDGVILVDTTSGNVTITLPPAALAGSGALLRVKKVASVNKVIVDADGAELIDGSTEQEWTRLWLSLLFVSDGSAWYRV